MPAEVRIMSKEEVDILKIFQKVYDHALSAAQGISALKDLIEQET